MKRLVRNLGVLLCIVVVLCSLYFGIFFMSVPAQYADNYNASLIDKVDRLESIDEPKIILVGNSNLAYGINSELIEESMGMPVANLGLHGGLGNKFLERIALLGINEGDLVIICHTDYSDKNELKQADLAWITLENHWELWKIPDAKMWGELLVALPDYTFNAMSLYLSGRGNQSSDEVYARKAFNVYGDNVSHRESGRYEIEDSSVTVPEINDECVKRINKLGEYCDTVGAKLVIAGYPIMVGEDTPNKDCYTLFQNELRDKMNCEIISDYEDYFFAKEYFYDGCLHMTNEGADLRTSQLIRDIEKMQSQAIEK
ncbi:MAG: hypothetical protein HFH75_02985 [Lachnospiraceae bacterium]|jgi:hypothetical protein|nr:hypothetical protein [Lachnospiraceae bacterium]